jgi:hypothetical protein
MQSIQSLPVLALAAALALPLCGQDHAPQGPTPRHAKLAQQVGTWTAQLEYQGMDGKPTKSSGTSVRKQPLGGFWLIDNFEANLMGQKFRGQGTTGYDPIKKKYVGTWIDSMSPSLMVIEGNYDKAGKVLTMEGMGVDPLGQPSKARLVTTIKDQNTHVFEMFSQGPDGKFAKTMTITYQRRVRKMDRVR